MFRELLNDKIGNVLVYFSENIPNLCLTKAIKLLFLLDETSMKETGVPVTWLDYKAWKFGPVPPVLHDELRHDKVEIYKEKEISLKSFIEKQEKENPKDNEKISIYLKAKVPFNDDDFSRYELDLMANIVKKYGHKTVQQLVDLLHKDGSLWAKVVDANDLNQLFDNNIGKSEESISLTEYIKGDEYKLAAYSSAYHSLNFQNKLN